MVTIVATLLFSSYMLFDPAESFADFMQLTRMSVAFKSFVLILASGGFMLAWIGERRTFPWFARLLGKTRDTLWPRHRKQRKKYKELVSKLKQ